MKNRDRQNLLKNHCCCSDQGGMTDVKDRNEINIWEIYLKVLSSYNFVHESFIINLANAV